MFGASVCTIGALILLAAPSELAFELTQWLKRGVWPHLRLIDLWINLVGGHPYLNWHGMQEIVTWVFAWPVSVGFVLVGLLISLVGRQFEG